MILPTDPSDLAALLRQIEAHASTMAAKLDRKVFEQRPESTRASVRCAVDALYFYGDDGNEHCSSLRKIVAWLAPEIATVMLDEGVDVAYRILHPEEEP